MRIFVVLTTFLLVSFNCFSQTQCEEKDNLAQQKGVRFDSYNNGFSVTGHGRLYFYSAPDVACKNKDTFIVPGDVVNAYLDFNGYYSVMYFRGDGSQVEGWVKSSRLKENGTGNGPKQ
ncbi:hypothetical protein PMPD1_0733 [Paramixta manurensis]|uniref:SH3 domain-containing protein n=1 Tax=Paramixta manurensis TaxID=2740817 RepID=A0A6M8U4Z7_9GAMM|nr:hypothetical protein PMPD1_0733 [Erwiniaceae bacterium PD-1]